MRGIIGGLGSFDVRVSTSQVAFRRRRGFAYLWMPGMYLDKPAADVVLSIALGRLDGSRRFQQAAHPTPRIGCATWRSRDLGDIDDEVADWLRGAAERAG